MLAAVVQFFICEAVCASAWSSAVGHHGYDYARNWISDLGAPGRPADFEGSLFVSPLHSLMDASLGTLALFGLLAGLLLTRALPASRLRLIMRTLVVVFSSGVALVALFPETTHITVHNLGATLTVAADVLALLIGIKGAGLGVRRWVARCCLALGLLGGSVGTVFAFDLIDSAVAERIADYAPLAACIVVGIAAVLPRRAVAPEQVIDLTDAAMRDRRVSTALTSA